MLQPIRQNRRQLHGLHLQKYILSISTDDQKVAPKTVKKRLELQLTSSVQRTPRDAAPGPHVCGSARNIDPSLYARMSLLTRASP